MKLGDYKVVFAAVGLIGVLLLASPTLSLVLRLLGLPGGEAFSELWVLGPGQMAEDYPFNVTAGVNYLVYVDVGNHMGSSVYYEVCVKFRNETEPLPNDKSGVPSVLPALYTYRIFLQDGGNSSVPLTFSFSDISYSGVRSTVGIVTINGVQSTVDESVLWDSVNRGYYYQLFMELWIYNQTSNTFSYDNRFVSLWLRLA
jgi:hypothetical protein